MSINRAKTSFENLEIPTAAQVQKRLEAESFRGITAPVNSPVGPQSRSPVITPEVSPRSNASVVPNESKINESDESEASTKIDIRPRW